jgi:hypothetical protein
MDYQIAQKSHAATDPDIPPDIINDRVRDVIDMVLVKENLYIDDPTPASLRTACVDVFEARAEEAKTIGATPRSWPPTFTANAAWQTAYPDLAKSVGITYTLDEAIVIVQNWIDAIDELRSVTSVRPGSTGTSTPKRPAKQWTGASPPSPTERPPLIW